MRLISCEFQNRTRWGFVDDQHALLVPLEPSYPATVLDAIDAGLTQCRALYEQLRVDSGTERVAMSGLSLLAPIPRPRKNIICLGLNYLGHAQESQRAKGQEVKLLEHPVVFTKNVTAVTAPYADIPLDARVSEQMDWEVELAVVIGKPARRVPESDALDHVFGYTVVNDISARDIQFRHQQFFLGKSLDHSCPMGPWIVTADELADAQNLDIACRVNGAIKQAANTREQLFGIARTISILSQSMPLEPGDVIATGTPEGVGFARKPPEFLRPGDVLESEIAGIGTLRNRIVEGGP
jgi:2-keto-4-pentenoate hydratase/2-oxohepta-3-ene-1,7-dioic acid hydratase in catechol pathway